MSNLQAASKNTESTKHLPEIGIGARTIKFTDRSISTLKHLSQVDNLPHAESPNLRFVSTPRGIQATARKQKAK